MVTTDYLSLYYGSVIGFTKETKVSAGATEKIYRKGDEIHITPAVLFMVGGGVIPRENFKIVLRKLEQLEDKELLELAEIAAPRTMFTMGFIRRVKRKNKPFSLKVVLSDTHDLLINERCDLAIIEKTIMPAGITDIITPITPWNQVSSFLWLLRKHIDFHNLIQRKLAASRTPWTADGYENPGSPRFKNRKQ